MRLQNGRLCEFTNPCNTNSPHPRKLISHIFGRNKTVTRTFPDHVWVYFCRKHYQRSRYRDALWALRQCDILELTLDRMESWGQVRVWEIVRRRRAMLSSGMAQDGSAAAPAAPADPDTGLDTDADVSGADTDAIDTDGVEDEDGDEEDTDADMDPTSANTNANTNTTATTSTTHRTYRTRRNRPNPIPSWLIDELGPNKSFQDIRTIITRLREDIQARRVSRFPDIEILPNFYPGVYALRQQQQQHQISGLSQGSSAVTGSSNNNRSSSSSSRNTSRVDQRGRVRKLGRSSRRRNH